MDSPVGSKMEGVMTHSLLAGLDSNVAMRLVAASSYLDVLRGNIVFREGDKSAGIYLVLKGQIKILLQTGHGREKVIDLIAAGGSFGEPALLLDRPQPANAEADSDAALLCLGRTAVLHEIRNSPQFAERMVSTLAGRMYGYVENMKSHLLLSGTQRVICFLLSSLPEDEAETGRDVAITFPVRKGVIASKLNLTQEHFSRILHDLSEAALIEVAGPRVRIRDIGRLRAMQAAA